MVFISTLALYSQEFRPVGGNFTAETQFRPFNASPISLDYLRGRYFISDDMAIRTGLNIYMKTDKSTPENATGGNDEDKKSTTMFGLYPGIEKHFGDLPKLSPYIGVELIIGMKTSKEVYTDKSGTSNAETTSKGAWIDGSERGNFTLGLNLLIGTDFYFSENIYMGMEMGFGFQNVSNSKIEVEGTGQPTVTVSKKDSQMEIGINYVPAIRLGYAF